MLVLGFAKGLPRFAPSSKPVKTVAMGARAEQRRRPGADDLAARVPAIAALPPEQRQVVARALARATAPCEPCAPETALSVCLIEAPAGCENLPVLAARAARVVARGASEDAARDAVAYGDVWLSQARRSSPEDPPPVDLWTALDSPFLPGTLQTARAVQALPQRPDLRVHVWMEAEDPARLTLARALAAADKQGLALVYADAWWRRSRAEQSTVDLSSVNGTNSSVVAAAADVAGLDLSRWEADRGSAELGAALALDQVRARHLGVRAVPTWTVSGYRLRGLQSVSMFQRALSWDQTDRLAAISGAPWVR